MIDDQDIDENWPHHLNPISPGNAVYLAQGHTYTPDPNRMASEREMIEMMDLATQFERCQFSPTLII